MPNRRPSRTSSPRRPARPDEAVGRPRPTAAATAAATPARSKGGYGLESLEPRRLMTTFSGTGSFIYADGAGAAVQLLYQDVTFEAIAIQQATATTQVALTNMIPYPVPTGDVGENLFKIYITDASADSDISIADIDTTTGDLSPYSGSVTFASVSTAGVAPYSVSIAAGGVVLGDPDNGNGNPTGLPSVPVLNSIGLQPAPESGFLTAGVEMANVSPTTDLPNNFGNFLVGGTVFGQVYFGGNVNEFYAGGVLTGNLFLGASGLVSKTTAPLADVVPTVAVGGATSTAAAPPRFANFTVTGDLRQFNTIGPVGTDGAGTAAVPLYVTDFGMTVGGTLGEMHVGNQEVGSAAGDLAGTINVRNDATIASGVAPTGDTFYNPGDTADQTETELEASNYIGNEFNSFEAYLPNNTINDAQVLGSFPMVSATTGVPTVDSNGNLTYGAVVDGTLQGIVQGLTTDTSDYYAMAFLAGQTFTVSITGGADVDIYDPDGRLVASNAEAATGPVQITADRPGLYRFDVVEPTTAPAQIAYELTITGTGDLGIGGVVATGFYTDDGFDSGLVVDRGDFGAIELFGLYASLTSGPTPSNDAVVPLHAATSIGVNAGDLRAVIAAQIGIRSTGDTLVLVDGPTLNVPFGNVGLVRSTTDVLDLNTQFDPNYLGLATPQDVTDDADAAAVGGDIQIIDAATTYQGDLAINGGLGTLHAGDMITDTASFFDVNANNTGNDGIIDLLDVPGQVGTARAGGPQFVTNDGGQIRYMLFGGVVYRDELFGLEADVVTGGFGAAMSFTDQAGNLVTVTPIGPVTYADSTTTSNTTSGTTGTTGTTTGLGSSTGGVGSGAAGSGGAGSTGDTTGGASTTGGTGGTGGSSTGTSGGTTTSGSTNPITTTTSSTEATAGPQVTLSLYPVRDKGGEVPISVTSTGGLEVASADTAGNNGELDIATVTAEGTGRAIGNTTTTDRYGNTVIAQANASGVITTATVAGVPANDGGTTSTSTRGINPLSASQVLPQGGVTDDPTDEVLVYTGSTTVNVLNTVLTGSPVAVLNTTKGELVDVNAPAIGTLQTVGNVGFATPEATPAAVMPRAVIANGNSYPFLQQHTGVVIGSGIANTGAGDVGGSGDVVDFLVGGGVANVQVGGVLQTLVANYLAKSPPGQFDGIDGPVVATSILNTNIGQGIEYNGSGLAGTGGLFATNVIGVVDNNGNPGANIRGAIVSGAEGTTQSISYVQLVNGSIIDAHIEAIVDANFAELSDLGPPLTSGGTFTNELPSANPYQYDIGAVSVSGLGGIIGSDIGAQNIGPVIVANGGFGILQSSIVNSGLGRIAQVDASGYGIRDTTIGGGGYLGPIIATGNGSQLATATYPLAVRESDAGNMLIDPAFGMLPSPQTDIEGALGVTSAAVEAGVTDTGAIEDDTIFCQQDLTALVAHSIRTAQPDFLPVTVPGEPVVPNIPYYGTPFVNSVSVGGTIGKIAIYGVTDGLQVVAGRLRRLQTNGNVSRLGIAVAGSIDFVTAHGNLGQTITDPGTDTQIPDSYIRADGPAGQIMNLQVFGSLAANTTVTGRIGTFIVNGDIAGSLTDQGNVTGTNPANVSAYSVQMLRVAGGIRDGSLSLAGRVNNLIVNGGLGASTDTLTLAGSANKISVGASRQPGAKLALALTVNGSVNQLSVYGQITGSVKVLGNLQSLLVTGDGQSADAIAGPITVTGNLANATVTNGNVAADVTVGGNLNSFTVNRGSILAGATLLDQLGNIRNVRVGGGAAYGIDGSVMAPAGVGLSVSTTGALGDGTDPATISALSGNAISIGGNVSANAKVAIVATLNNLTVGGSIAAGGSVSGHPIRHSRVHGTTTGTLVTT